MHKSLLAGSTLAELWKAGQFSAVADSLIKYTQKPAGKNATMYRLIVEALRRAERNTEATRYWNRYLYVYSTASEQPDIEYDNALSDIVEANETRRIAAVSSVLKIIFGSGAGSGGKIFSKFGIDELEKMNRHEVIEVKAPKTIAELTERLFEPDDVDSGYAVSVLDNLVKPLTGRFRIVNSDHFLLVCSSPGLSDNNLLKICEDLEICLRFFVKQYQMTIPPYLITVYLVPTLDRMSELAEEIHGLKIPPRCIGYFFQDDLSIVAVIHRMIYGTLTHELFHLTARMNFGDIPPWLDEGMAALYEECTIDRTAASIKGLPNWRGERILTKTGLEDITEIVQMDAMRFHYPEDEYAAVIQAINHATARYFVLWLQNNDKLVEVYTKFRDRKIDEMESDPGTDAVYLLESILGPLSDAQRDLEDWFKTVHP
ncbi:MAG: hypothetical protein WBB67_09075 [bacterium]